MRINLKSKTIQSNHSVIRLIVVFFITAAAIVAILFSDQIINTLQLPFRLLGLSGQATVITNGADQWDNNDMITAPVINFSPLSSNILSVSPRFTRTYQMYGTSNNSLGAPITAAFPTAAGWLQFFTNGALLLPSTQQGQTHNNDAFLADLTKNGVQDTATGVIRLPLIQTLLSTGSALPVAGQGSSLTYVDLRKATTLALMKPMPARDESTPTIPNPLSDPFTITSRGIFIQGGTREGKAVGHFIPTAFWNYINQPTISPHSWEKDFGAPLTEALTFTLPVNGQMHHMLIQVFSHEALILDQDTGQTQEVGTSSGVEPAHPIPTGSTNNTTAQPTIRLLPTGADYLSTVGMPTITIPEQKVAWAQSDTALLNTPGTGNPVAHVGQNFPLTLLGDTRWIGGIPWYHIQWSVPKQSQKGWISATALSFNSPGHVASTASIDALSAALSAYLNNLDPNVGVVVYDLTQQRTYTHNGSTQFITASSMKVPIMLTFLASIEQQRREPTDNEMALLTTMIENSDNDSATILFNEIGTTVGISTYMQKIGINDLILDDDSWGYSTITPQAMVDLLTLLYNGKILNRNHRALALNLMENVEPDQRVGVGDTAPHKATVALKDGWVPDEDGLWAMNSSGIVTVGKETYILSIYTQGQQALEGGQAITRKVCSTIASLLAPS
jgi:hypothetical protein